MTKNDYTHIDLPFGDKKPDKPKSKPAAKKTDPASQTLGAILMMVIFVVVCCLMAASCS